MIRVTVELLPHGDESRKKTLGIMAIANDASGDAKTGNYKYVFGLSRKQIWRSGEIKGFPRLRLNAWDLLYRVLRRAVSDRNV